MSKYRNRLPQLDDQLFITDGGLETTMIFLEHLDLPLFASFCLLKTDEGTAKLEEYFSRYATMARSHHVGLILEAPTWRASPDWGAKLGYDAAALAEVNRKAIALLAKLRERYETSDTPTVISGNLGPRGDGYRPEARMTPDEARQYHQPQVATFAQTEADMVAAFTMNYIEEAIGITLAAKACAMPVAISFTTETDGKLPTGDALEAAIRRTDEATSCYPEYYMINCAHPAHFMDALRNGGDWLQRIRGLRANASRRSHAELDECSDLDDGDPEELGRLYGDLRMVLPQLTVVGGCCGTDHRHVDAILHALREKEAPVPA